jgi:hypothetical protein
MTDGKMTEGFFAMGAVISSARTHALRGDLLLSSEPVVTSLGKDAQSYWLAQEGDPKRSQMNG